MEKRFEQIVQVVAVAALVIGCLMVLRPFLAAVLSAAILCFSTWPVYERIERGFGGRHGLAALAMTLMTVLVLVLPLALTAATYANEVPDLVENLRVVMAQGLPGPPDWVASIPVVGDALNAGWRDMVSTRAKRADAWKAIAEPARAMLVQAGIIVGEGVLQFALISFIGFFIYRDGTALARTLRNGVNRFAGKLTDGLLEIVGSTVNAVIYGIVGTGLAQGIAAVIGFLIAGVPGALLLGFLTFFLSILPAGPPLLWVGATVWLYQQGRPGWALFMAVWGFFVISGIDNVVKPLLISRSASLPFALVLLGVFGGILAFGFVGIFLGPTLLAVGFNLVRRWAAPQPPPQPPTQ